MNQLTHTAPQFAPLRPFIEQIPALFHTQGTTVYTGRNTIKIINTPSGIPLAVKHFGHLPLIRRIIYSTVAHSKARRAFTAGQKFAALGFNTPAPVAYIEIRRRGILADAFFISLASTATAAFIPLVQAPEFNRTLASQVAALMAALHKKGALHGDPNLNNILVAPPNPADPAAFSHLTLIDTNRSSFRPRPVTGRRALRNLMRVTHRRDLISHIAQTYAALSGLPPQPTIRQVMRLLTAFERRRTLRHKIKALLHLPVN